jgi:hypothetical protein
MNEEQGSTVVYHTQVQHHATHDNSTNLIMAYLKLHTPSYPTTSHTRITHASNTYSSTYSTGSVLSSCMSRDMIALLHSKSLRSSGRSTPVVCIVVEDVTVVMRKEFG